MEREQFTFFASFHTALQRIRKPSERCAAYDAICAYALTGELPDLDKLPDAAAIAFELIRPVLDSGKRKAESGRTGGSKAEANRKQTGSKAEANGKQSASEGNPEAKPKREQSASEKEGEDEKEGEKEIENECYSSPQDPPGGSPAPKAKAHKHGANGWVLLTDEQYARLAEELGAEELARCIAYIDEQAQSTGNKNRWKDWNLVLRRCSREGWGKRQEPRRSPAHMSASSQKPLSTAEWDKLMDKI